MPTLRAIRLLQSVEAGNTLGAELETFLQDDGRLGEIKFLLSMRGQTRRIANNPVTIAAFLLSPKAIDAVFTLATPNNNTASTAMVASPVAMAALSVDSSALDSIFGNVTSRNLFTASENYSENVLSVTTLLAGLSRTTYSTKTLLFAAPSAMAAVFSNLAAARSVVVDQDMLTRSAASSIAVETIATSPEILGVFAPSSMAMTTFAANNSAMQEFVVNDDPMEIFSQSPVAMAAISSNATAWTIFQGSHFFSSYLKDTIVNILGLTGSYANVDAIIADAVAMASLAESTPACEALASNPVAIATLASSPNLSIIMGSTTAMGVFGTEANIAAFLAVPAAIPVVFGSAIANGIIVASTTLMNVVAGTPAITGYLSGFAVTHIPSNLNAINANNVFGGFPDKFITLKIRANNIGAIAMTFTLAGSPLAGTGSNVISASGTVTATAVFGLSNPATWKASGIAATAAASPEVTYIDMTGAIG